MDGTLYNGNSLFPATLPFLDLLKQLASDYEVEQEEGEETGQEEDEEEKAPATSGGRKR